MPDISQTISHYKILEKIGGGGMGVVYVAEDTRLGRRVALKFLSEEMSRNRQSIERFQREARSASGLNHPNICTIYEIDEHEGQHFIAMEYLKGQNLRQLVLGRPLQMDDILDLAIQITDGLDAAHSEGIIHRDLKPANIFITSRGHAKILDFGVAKLLPENLRGTGTTAEVTSERTITTPGEVVGTVAYMSPEQTLGKRLDARSDLFSFGVVLYEMGTGIQAFTGSTSAIISDAVLHKAPTSPVRLNPEIPDELEHVINKALEKDREVRYQSAKEILVDLKRIRRDSETGKVVIPPGDLPKRPKISKVTWTFTGIVALLLIAALVLILRPVGIVEKSSNISQPTHKQITFVGEAVYPAISPDGLFAAYVTENLSKLILQDLTGGQPIEIFKGANISLLRWSPDGSKLAFRGYNQLIVLPRLGGEFRPYPIYFHSFCWSPDGSQIAGNNNGTPKKINFVDVATGEIKNQDLRGTFEWIRDIDWSPNNSYLLFITSQAGKQTIWTTEPSGDNQKEVYSSDVGILSSRWSPNGEAIYYLLDTKPSELWKLVLSSEKGLPIGSPVRLLSGIEIGPHFTVSHQKGRMLYARHSSYNNIWVATSSQKDEIEFVTKSLTHGTSTYGNAQISPDGKQLALTKHDPATSILNLFVMPLEGGPQRQITFSEHNVLCLAWSPEGKEIAFTQKGEDGVRVWKINSFGGLAKQFSNTSASESGYISWSPGRRILYQKPGNRNFGILDPITQKEESLIKDDSVGWSFNPCYSPDNTKVALFWNRHSPSPSPGLWTIDLKDYSEVQMTKERRFPLIWSKDGKWIYVGGQIESQQIERQIDMIQVQGSQTRAFYALPENASFCSMTSDGNRIIYFVFESKSDIWLAENFDPE